MLSSIVNKNLLKHPLNWLVIWSMVLIGGFLFHLIWSYVSGKHPGASSVSSVAAGPGTSTNTTDPTATS